MAHSTEHGFSRAKKQLVIAGGLAIAGTLDRTTGGVLLLAGWLGSVAALHKLGRSGTDE